MKKMILLFTLISFSVVAGAQQSAYRNENIYYAPVLNGPNGYRTVDEENRLMEQLLAERRREHKLEESNEQEIAKAVKKNEEREAAHRKMFEGDKPQPQAKAKK